MLIKTVPSLPIHALWYLIHQTRINVRFVLFNNNECIRITRFKMMKYIYLLNLFFKLTFFLKIKIIMAINRILIDNHLFHIFAASICYHHFFRNIFNKAESNNYYLRYFDKFKIDRRLEKKKWAIHRVSAILPFYPIKVTK